MVFKNRKTKWIIIIGILLTVHSCMAKFAMTPFRLGYIFPDYGDDIRYWAPAWQDNEHILFIKNVFNYKLIPYFIIFGGKIELDNRTYLCSMKIDGSEKKELKEITTKKDTWQPEYISWSDKNMVLISATGKIDAGGIAHSGILLIDLNKGTEKMISMTGQYADFSPDGERVVYADRGISIIDINGQNKQQITDNPGDSRPLSSPDGKRVAFEKYIDKKYDGDYILNIKDKKQNKIWNHGFLNWTGDNEYIWTAKGMIDVSGHLIKAYPEEIGGKVIPYGTLSPNGLKVVSAFRRDDFFIGDIDGNEIGKLATIQQTGYGKMNRKQVNNIWIK